MTEPDQAAPTASDRGRPCRTVPIEGDRIRNRLTGQVYRVEKIKVTSVVLRSEDGSTRVWLDRSYFADLYETI